MTFEEIDARARELFSTENDASRWAYLDEGDRTHWRKMAIEELEPPDRRFFWLDAEQYDAFANRLDTPPPRAGR